jgi:perosamine synthetase
MKLFPKTEYPISEKISKKGFYIPSGVGITREEQDVVINKVINLFKNIK